MIMGQGKGDNSKHQTLFVVVLCLFWIARLSALLVPSLVLCTAVGASPSTAGSSAWMCFDRSITPATNSKFYEVEEPMTL